MRIFICNDYFIRVFKKMDGFWKNFKLCDIVLVVGEKRIKVYCFVFVVFSDYFSVMFIGDLVEKC